MPSIVTDIEIYAQSSKFDIEILEEASYILWNIWRVQGNSKYSTLSACIHALNEDGNLYQALKVAHKMRKYEPIRTWCT